MGPKPVKMACFESDPGGDGTVKRTLLGLLGPVLIPPPFLSSKQAGGPEFNLSGTPVRKAPKLRYAFTLCKVILHAKFGPPLAPAVLP